MRIDVTAFITKREQRPYGEDYVRCFDELPDDEPYWCEIKVAGKGSLSVAKFADKFQIDEQKPDGSRWSSGWLTRDRILQITAAFVRGDDWRQGIEWEKLELGRRESRRRLIRILIILAVVIVLARLLKQWLKP